MGRKERPSGDENHSVPHCTASKKLILGFLPIIAFPLDDPLYGTYPIRKQQCQSHRKGKADKLYILRQISHCRTNAAWTVNTAALRP